MSQAIVRSKSNTLTTHVTNVFLLVGASLFIALCAKIKIPLFFTPIPMTLQTFAILLVGCTLGSKRGALALGLYLAEAALGMPVLTGINTGILSFIGPTAGFLAGFVLQAYLAGLYVEHFTKRRMSINFLVLGSICALQLAVGSLWLGTFVGWNNALAMGFFPFLTGELLKSLIVARCIRS